METFAFVFVYGCLIVFGLLPALYEYEKACRSSYNEVRKTYALEEIAVHNDEKLSFFEWADKIEVLDTSYRTFSVSRNYGGNFFFF